MVGREQPGNFSSVLLSIPSSLSPETEPRDKYDGKISYISCAILYASGRLTSGILDLRTQYLAMSCVPLRSVW